MSPSTASTSESSPTAAGLLAPARVRRSGLSLSTSLDRKSCACPGDPPNEPGAVSLWVSRCGWDAAARTRHRCCQLGFTVLDALKHGACVYGELLPVFLYFFRSAFALCPCTCRTFKRLPTSEPVEARRLRPRLCLQLALLSQCLPGHFQLTTVFLPRSSAHSAP